MSKSAKTLNVNPNKPERVLEINKSSLLSLIFSIKYRLVKSIRIDFLLISTKGIQNIIPEKRKSAKLSIPSMLLLKNILKII